jgi:crotonobetainyl-CoA:carnitine CoA-transferase CaiB-like acyl-CoA transferase
MRPLEGVRVLDLSRVVAGAMAGAVLADLGAEVWKVEQPEKGDPLREWVNHGEPLWWRVYGRNKLCISLNFQRPESKKLIRKLVEKADVVLENFIPGTLERYGIGFDVMSGWNPKLIMGSISGWGQSGPESKKPGFGTLVEAATGLAAMSGDP